MRWQRALVLILLLLATGVFVANERAIHKGPGSLWIEVLSGAGILPADVLNFPGFENVTRRATGNDALACRSGRCGATRADFEVPTYAMPASELFSRIMAIGLAEPRTVALKTTPEDLRADFQQASATLRFPDIVSVQVFELGPNESTLAIWSRSVVGRKDFGVNRARVERWLQALSR
jgi:uncharacterized protein (DUF1499 family)